MKNFIVTGASRGIGFAISKRLLSRGYMVYGISRDTSKLDFNSYDCDIQSYEELKAISVKIKNQKIRIDGLINAAGVASMNLALMTPKHVTERLINTNLLGTIFASQIFSPLIIRNKSGIIINFSTIAVALGLKGESVYCASKAGIEGFTKSFSREMADFNVKVNCIAPGPIKTSLISGISKNQLNNIVDNQIIRKIFKVSDVCDLVEILIDPKSKSLAGQTFHVGGV